MSCYYHSDREPVGTCPTCNKQLCKDCFELTVGHVCYDCAKEIHRQAKSSLKLSTIIAIITVTAGIVGIILMSQGGNMNFIGGGIYILACIVPAWKFLSKLANKILGPREYFGLMIFFAFFIKLLLAIFISLVVPFVYIVLAIMSIINYNRVNKDMKNIEASHQFITLNN